MNEPDTHKLDYQTPAAAGPRGAAPPAASMGCAAVAVLTGTICLVLAGYFGSLVVGTWRYGRWGKYEELDTHLSAIFAVPFVLAALGLLAVRVRPLGIRIFVLLSVVALVGMAVMRLMQLRYY